MDVLVQGIHSGESTTLGEYFNGKCTEEKKMVTIEYMEGMGLDK